MGNLWKTERCCSLHGGSAKTVRAQEAAAGTRRHETSFKLCFMSAVPTRISEVDGSGYDLL